MSGILKPFSNLLSPVKQVPTGPLRIDNKNRLARNLIDCVLFNSDGAPVNISAALPATLVAVSTPTSAMTALGPAKYATGGSGYKILAHSTSNPAICPITAAYAIRVLFFPVTWPADYTTLFDNTNRSMSLFFTSAGNINFSTGGATSLTTGTTAGSIWDLLLTGTTTSPTVYVNGISKGTLSGWTTVWNTGDLNIGPNPSGGGHAADIKYIAVQIWNRLINADEAMELFNNPFGFLVPAEYEMPILQPQAGAAFLAAWAQGSNLPVLGAGNY